MTANSRHVGLAGRFVDRLGLDHLHRPPFFGAMVHGVIRPPYNSARNSGSPPDFDQATPEHVFSNHVGQLDNSLCHRSLLLEEPAIQSVAVLLFRHALAANQLVSALHFPGSENVVPDLLS